MLAFAAACILLIITPGPGVLSVAGVGSGFGFAKGSIYLWGLCIGNILVGLAVVSGLAATIFAVPYLRQILLVLSAGYMLYLAAKVAFSGSEIGFIKATKAPGLIDGIALQTINPKAYVANSLLFSGFTIFADNLTLEISTKFVIWVGIWIPVHFAWLALGVGIRHMNLEPSTQRIINYGMAISLLIAVGLAFGSGLKL